MLRPKQLFNRELVSDDKIFCQSWRLIIGAEKVFLSVTQIKYLNFKGLKKDWLSIIICEDASVK